MILFCLVLRNALVLGVKFFHPFSANQIVQVHLTDLSGESVCAFIWQVESAFAAGHGCSPSKSVYVAWGKTGSRL